MSKMSSTDSGYAWVIPFVCFFIQAALFGTYRVYGLLYTVLIDALNVSRSAAAWPFSLCMTFIHLTGPVSGLLNKYFSSRQISFVGCFLAALGVGLCYTATSVFQIIIYIGIIQGFGIGLTYVQNNEITNQYFIKYRATANGISLSGGTIGSFALSYLVELCLKYYTLQEIFLILSAFILCTLPICLLMKPFNDVKSKLLDEVTKIPPKELCVNDLDNYDQKCSKGQLGLPLPKYVSNAAYCEEIDQDKVKGIEVARRMEFNRRVSQLNPKDMSLFVKEERKRIKENNEQVMKVATVYLKSYKDTGNGLTFTGSNAIMVPFNTSGKNGNNFIRKESFAAAIGKTVVDITKRFERRVSNGCNSLDIYNHDPRMCRSDTVNSRTAVLDTSESDLESRFRTSSSALGEGEESVMKLVVNILKNKMFMLICLTHMAYFWSSITYTMIIVDFSLDKGIGIAQSVNLLNSFAAGDLIGRLGSGWFMDNSILPLHSLALFSTTGMGILLSITPLANNYYFFLAVSAILGLLSGTINILLNVLFCKYVGISKAGLAFGLSAFFCGLCTLGRPLVVGHFRDQVDGSYDGLFLTLGIVTIVIGSLWLFESCIRNCCDMEDEDEDEEPKTVSDEISNVDSMSYVEKV